MPQELTGRVEVGLTSQVSPEELDRQCDAYDRAIRAEYAHVPDGAYRAGRSGVLRGFLSRERLFLTPEFAALDAPARLNLRRALERLA